MGIVVVVVVVVLVKKEEKVKAREKKRGELAVYDLRLRLNNQERNTSLKPFLCIDWEEIYSSITS